MSAAHHPDEFDDDLPPLEIEDLPSGPAPFAERSRTNGTSPAAPAGESWAGESWTEEAWEEEPWEGASSAAEGGGAGEVRLSGAGVVVVRATDAGARVAVLESGGIVSLPKAEVGPGESSETAATRAAEAFTGRRVRLAESLGQSIEFVDGAGVATWFWLARPTRAAGLDGHAGPPAGFTLHWLDVEEAASALSSSGERALVERLRTQPLPERRRPFSSASRRTLVHDLEAFRDDSVALARTAESPEQLEALLRSREEIERAEDRLARGDEAGARRARARAEREALLTLDPEGRRVALQRALDRAPAHLRSALAAASPSPGLPVTREVLLAVQSAVDAAVEEEARGRDARRTAQNHATAALAVTTLAALTAAWFGLFRDVPRPVLGTVAAAVVFLIAGQLGGWVGESLYVLRERNASRHLSLPLAAATGGLAGLAVGAVLSGGLGGFLIEDAALTVAATFLAGWVVRMILPRGS